MSEGKTVIKVTKTYPRDRWIVVYSIDSQFKLELSTPDKEANFMLDKGGIQKSRKA